MDEGLGVVPRRKDSLDSFSSLTCRRCFVRVMFSSKFNGLALDRIIQHSFIMKDEWSVWWADAILPMTYVGFPDLISRLSNVGPMQSVSIRVPRTISLRLVGSVQIVFRVR